MNGLHPSKNGWDLVGKDEVKLLYKVLGSTPKERWEKCKSIYHEFPNIILKEYDEEHKINEEIMNDIKDMIESTIKNDE